MTANRYVRTSIAALIGAWAMAVPAAYLLYDYWLRGLDPSAARSAMLRPYAFYVGAWPLLLFWGGSVFATLTWLRAARLGLLTSGQRLLGMPVLLLGVGGSVAGTFVGVPLVLVLLRALATGHMPLGLLILVGGLSAGGIWAVRPLLREVEPTAKTL